MEKRILRFLGTVLCVCVTICVYSIMTRSEYAPAYGPKSLNATKIWRQKNVPFSTITRKQASKDGDSSILPEESLEKLVHFNSCAVVSSSHGLRLHKYGQEIEHFARPAEKRSGENGRPSEVFSRLGTARISGHDAVLRFNSAPTQGFEQFVGNRTDIRLVNTQIPGRYLKKDFWSKNSNMFKHETIVVRNMDSISVKGEKIDTKGDHFHVFDNLIKYRKMYPERDLHFIQRPDFGNDIMRELARFCITTGMCNKANMSPSSGIFGVVMMLHLCDWVRVYEIVPSNKDRTTVPYYYDEQTTTTWTWLKKWHSFTQERIYLRTLSLTPEKDINETGVVLLKGFSQTQCH
ncbi:beta-galactoside alpha-2,6-sialyltransferase [Branchiostoma belcheri]|nr:beta-galactoside alpha-2,6-sialyltransferase [Branchiostoma belcheri]